ncbi:MAG: helix-turn-helix domain-containing protein [Oscillospiraceae bacterium]|nr:helix-turn-helix domain-containing protein [Oscillospiraceae bacterium]
MASFSDRVKELRKTRNMTQRQMADALGITERSYQRYEAENNPNNETLIKLADFFEVSTDYLLGRSDNPKRQ